MANEKRLIDANAFWESVSTDYWEHFTQCHTTDQIDLMEMVEENLTEQPTVNAVEVVHGRWGKCGGDLHSSGYAIFCSVCNKTHFVHYKYSLGGLTDNELFEKPKYCPSCGAVMEVEE